MNKQIQKLLRARDEVDKKISKSDIDKIEELAKKKDIFTLLQKSVAPKIYGFDKIKETIVLQLFGDTSTILIGDPGTAKSSFIEAVSQIAKKEVLCIKRLERLVDEEKRYLLGEIEKPGRVLSVFATANPELGRFDPYTPIPEQVNISPTILSKFDIIFIIRDLPDKAQDEIIASHILGENTYNETKGAIDKALIKKYATYAKANFDPLMSDEAKKELKNFYVRIRNPPRKKNSEILPIAITARQLGTLVNLSKARARVRLSKEVSKEDAREAIDLLKCSLSMIGYDDLLELESNDGKHLKKEGGIGIK